MKSSNNGEVKKPKIDKRTLITRIVAWILVIMTIVTTLYTAIYFIIESVHAAEVEEDFEVAVGILYGSNAEVSLTMGTTNGFIVGAEVIDKYDKSFTELWRLDGCKSVTVLCDANYQKSGSGKKTVYKSTATPNVGAYRLELPDTYRTREELTADIANIGGALAGTDFYPIPTYINGEYKVRLGAFLTKAEAESAASGVTEKLSGKTLTVKSPSATGTYAVEQETARVLFEYDCGSASHMAFDAVNGSDGTEAYITNTKVSGNIYDGIFAFKRQDDKLLLLNVIGLEKYIAGVIPYEISASWPLEVQKAFAIIARTFAIDQVSKHWKQYGFNVCATANCQVYKGAAYINNERVSKAISSTRGMVTTYNGKLAGIYYSSSTGNCTADVVKVWGGRLEWLSGVETPWEDYLNHNKAFWTYEATPEELCAYLNNKGYTELKDAVADIKIDETASEISTYVYKVTVTDIHGTSVTIKRCDKVKSAFSKYLNSANFVVGKGSVEYTRYTKTVAPNNTSAKEPNTSAKEPGSFLGGVLSVLTSSGVLTLNTSDALDVMTANGQLEGGGSLSVLTADGLYTLDGENAGGEGADDPMIYTETATASTPDNFIFVGKGWGHGVGMSQFGIKDLDAMGIDYLGMIEAYCPGIKIEDCKKFVS